MTREEEVVNSMAGLLEGVKDLKGSRLTQEQIININLSTLAHELGDINVTLAIIADKLDKEESE